MKNLIIWQLFAAVYPHILKLLKVEGSKSWVVRGLIFVVMAYLSKWMMF